MTHFLRGANVSAHPAEWSSGEFFPDATISAHHVLAAGCTEATNEMDTLVITFTGRPAR